MVVASPGEMALQPRLHPQLVPRWGVDHQGGGPVAVHRYDAVPVAQRGDQLWPHLWVCSAGRSSRSPASKQSISATTVSSGSLRTSASRPLPSSSSPWRGA